MVTLPTKNARRLNSKIRANQDDSGALVGAPFLFAGLFPTGPSHWSLLRHAQQRLGSFDHIALRPVV